MSKIISLEIENVMGVKIAHITPEGNTVVIAGENGAGKSSALASIEMLLGGADHIPSKPIRRGEDKAKIIADLGDIIVKRTFTAAGNTTLVVTDKNDVPKRSPQELLNTLIGRLSFDPLAFCQQKPQEQAETLRKLMGLDFTKQDEEIAKLYEDRRTLNRDVAALKARGQGLAEYPDVEGQKEESTADIVAEQAKASNQNAQNEKVRAAADQVWADFEVAKNTAKQTEKLISELQAQLKAHQDKWAIQQEDVAKTQTKVADAKKTAQALVDIPLAPFTERVKAAEERNRKIRTNTAKAELRDQYRAKLKESETLTTKIDALEKAKRTAIQGSKFPVAGLTLSDTREVLLDGLPFNQANTAKQLEVSVAVGLAMNTQLRVLLIRRGSDLTPESMKLIAALAEKSDAQVWVETSRTDVQASVVMEDGCVQGAEVPA